MIRQRLTFLSVLFSLYLFLPVSCPLFPATCSLSYAEVPHLINYQGRLTDKDNKPLDGAYKITFRIYDALQGGNLLWEETHSNLSIPKGIFSVLLGSVSNLGLAFDKPYFLEIKVGDDEPMSPRQRITSAGYAITAENVLSIPKGIIVMWSGAIADIPAGWALCDGNNGTPNLKDRFVVGAGDSYAVSAKGGEAAHVLTIAEMPSHSHTYKEPVGGSEWGGSDGNAGSGRVSSATAAAGSGQAHENRPPYYALAYIMKL